MFQKCRLKQAILQLSKAIAQIIPKRKLIFDIFVMSVTAFYTCNALAQKGDFFSNSSIDNNFLSYLLFLSSA